MIMDDIDRREKDSETKINSRFTRGGKGDAHRTTQAEFEAGDVWCDHGRFKDKCDKCKRRKK
tara:strand:+ start:1749 stop:1934 length:186 start_codon:yes stop_codon:yes gene_type:complete